MNTKSASTRIQPDFVIPGPEAPIDAGAVDLLLEMGIPSIAPIKTVARLESSKSFTRDLLQKYGIQGNPKFRVFFGNQGLESYLKNELAEQFVIKADGLQGGKGVKVVGDHLKNIEEGLNYAKECLNKDGRVVVEEKLLGQEFSLMSFTDGTTILDMIPVQDHKRAYVNDQGPNTGGMGSYSDANHLLPFLTPQDLAMANEITIQVSKALHKETKTPFKGIIYGGFIATKNGIKLIEYNARFGDPEAMNVLPLLKTNFIEICQALIKGELSGLKLEFKKQASVCKYVVPQGYPDNPTKNEKIELKSMPENAKAYFASIDQRADGLYLMGSRAIALVGFGNSLPEAEQVAQKAALSIKGPVFFREDIGTEKLIKQKIKALQELRA